MRDLEQVTFTRVSFLPQMLQEFDSVLTAASLLPQGDVSETVRMFFEESKSFPAAAKSLLTIQEVDASLTRLAQLTKEDEQQTELESIAKK